MKNELVRNGYGHLFDKVIEQIQRVRTQVGGVALVTPTSEHVARQSIVNAMNGQDETNDNAPLWPGYSEMLRGVMGRPPSAADTNLVKRALREWTVGILKTELAHISDESVLTVIKDAVPSLVEFMWTQSSKVRNLRDSEDLKRRIEQLTKVNAQKYKSQIEESKNKLAALEKQGIASSDEDSKYFAILKCEPDDTTYKALLSGSGAIGTLVAKNVLSKADFLQIIKASTMCTVCPSLILEDGMPRSRDEIEKIAVDKEFGIADGCDVPLRGSVEFEEWAILQCMFKHAQNIAQFWFQHNQSNPQFWDKNFPADFPFDDRTEDELQSVMASSANAVMYPFRTKINRGIKKSESEIIEWSENELKRIFSADIEQLNVLQNKLKEVKGRSTENENRIILKQRMMEKTNNEIAELNKLIRQKVKSSIYNTKCHQAGYDIDVEQSIEVNMKKCLAL